MIDFVGKKKLYLIISGTVMALAIVCAVVFGVHLDIQFKGGTIISYSYTGDLDQTTLQTTVEGIIGQKVSIQEQTDVATGKKSFVITSASTNGIEADTQMTLTETLQTTYADNTIETISINNVDPIIGREFFAKSLTAVAFAALIILIYVAFRFKKISGWSAGTMAIIALVHDVIVVLATFIIFRIPINDSFIAVVLTILGYSMNDTIVIYDRIRENKKLFPKSSVGELVNRSINQSLFRSVATTISTVLALVVVSIVALIYNVNSILTFTFPMIIGMLSGVYSSICIAGPLWVFWQEYKTKKHGKLA